jgi:hypothetical protein
MPEDIEEFKDSLEEKEEKQTTVDKATGTETDNKLYEDINKDSKNVDIYQSTCESSEGAQNSSTEQQSNTSDNLPSTEIIAFLAILLAENHQQK